MGDERLYSSYGLNDYGWDDGMGCVDFEPPMGEKKRDEVDIIKDLLHSGRPFSGETARDLELMENPLCIDEPSFTGRQQLAPQHLPPKPTVPSTPVQASQPPTPAPASTPTPAHTSVVKATPQKNRNGKAKHKCEDCNQVFDTKNALSIHSGRIHKTKGDKKSTHFCKVCGKGFFNASYLSQHSRTHTGVKPYACDFGECTKAFRQLSHLQQHMRTHTGEKPYICTHPGCPKAFSQLSNLQSHTRSHLPEKDVHKCTSCYKCYVDEASLNSHLKTHMATKRSRDYRCDECGKSYTQDTYLQNHINSKHGGNSVDSLSYVCPTKKPTSIQAATSMMCKLEGAGAGTPCNKTGFEQPFMPEPAYQRSTQSVFPSIQNNSGEYEQHSSAFKPLPRQGALQSIESLASQTRRENVICGPSGPLPNYQLNSSSSSRLPGHSQQDAKAKEAERQQENFWKGRGMQGLAYPVLQNYMAGSNYSTYSSYMNTPYDSVYADKSGTMFHPDKSASMHASEAMQDYLMMGGLREAYQLD